MSNFEEVQDTDFEFSTGNNHEAITPMRCVCYNLKQQNGYSGFSFNVEPNQVATYIGANCTDHMHKPGIDTSARCYNGTLGDQNVLSKDNTATTFSMILATI